MNRSTLFASSALAASAVLVLTACSSGDPGDAAALAECSETTSINLALSWLPNVEFGGYFLADKAGYYADECLDVTFQPGGPNAQGVDQAVAAGSADIGIASATTQLLTAAARGNDFSIIGAQFQESPASLVSLAERPVTSVDDIVGQKVLLQSGVQPLVDALFTLAGLEPDYEAVTVGYDIGVLVSGDGIAYNGFATNEPITLETTYGLAPEDYVVTTFADLGMEQYADVLFAQTDWVTEHHDAVVGFLRATIRGWEDYIADPASAADLAVTEYGLDLALDSAQQERQAELQVSFLSSDATDEHGLFWVDADLFSGAMLDAQVAAGIESDKATALGLIDMGPLTEALEK